MKLCQRKYGLKSFCPDGLSYEREGVKAREGEREIEKCNARNREK